MKDLVINEGFLQQLESLQTLVKNNVAGLFGGNHKSKIYGSSCEFADHRDYLAGDDISKIDWNVYARSDRLYTKLYLDERQLHTRIYIDASRSMAFGKGKKDEQAIRLAATFAYLSVCETDKVSVYAVRENGTEEIISKMLGKEAYLEKIGCLNDVVFEGDCRLTEAVLPEDVGYGDGLTVVISDFLTDSDFEGAIDLFARKKRDILCVQVLSKEELNPKARGKLHYYDSEDTNKYYRKNINREIAQAYKKALDYATGRIRDYCLSRGGEYMLVSAEDSIGEIVFKRLVDMEVVK